MEEKRFLTDLIFDDVLGTFGTIWTNDGFRGLYRGLGPTIFGYLPTWAIYFTVYDKVKAHMGQLRGNTPSLSLSFSSSQLHGQQQLQNEREGKKNITRNDE
jgi:hypothetical protein